MYRAPNFTAGVFPVGLIFRRGRRVNTIFTGFQPGEQRHARPPPASPLIAAATNRDRMEPGGEAGSLWLIAFDVDQSVGQRILGYFFGIGRLAKQTIRETIDRLTILVIDGFSGGRVVGSPTFDQRIDVSHESADRDGLV